MNSLFDRWALVSAAVAAFVLVVCTIGLLRNVHLPSRDVVSQPHMWHRAYTERCQEEVGYGLCAVLAAGTLGGSINKLRNP